MQCFGGQRSAAKGERERYTQRRGVGEGGGNGRGRGLHKRGFFHTKRMGFTHNGGRRERGDAKGRFVLQRRFLHKEVVLQGKGEEVQRRGVVLRGEEERREGSEEEGGAHGAKREGSHLVAGERESICNFTSPP